ncbi:MAG: hypothetical protein JO206_01145 [Solirubrobacterales bacterium]|nr:hypothetical protein [Solirubrobacterales bacterium]
MAAPPRSVDLLCVVPLDQAGWRVEVRLRTDGTGEFAIHAGRHGSISFPLTGARRHELVAALLPQELVDA